MARKTQEEPKCPGRLRSGRGQMRAVVDTPRTRPRHRNSPTVLGPGHTSCLEKWGDHNRDLITD